MSLVFHNVVAHIRNVQQHFFVVGGDVALARHPHKIRRQVRNRGKDVRHNFPLSLTSENVAKGNGSRVSTDLIIVAAANVCWVRTQALIGVTFDQM